MSRMRCEVRKEQLCICMVSAPAPTPIRPNIPKKSWLIMHHDMTGDLANENADSWVEAVLGHTKRFLVEAEMPFVVTI